MTFDGTADGTATGGFEHPSDCLARFQLVAGGSVEICYKPGTDSWCIRIITSEHHLYDCLGQTEAALGYFRIVLQDWGGLNRMLLTGEGEAQQLSVDLVRQIMEQIKGSSRARYSV